MNKIVKNVFSKFSSKEKISTDKNMLMFQISELKKDKILYTLESLTVSMLALLLFIGAPSVFPEIINPYLPSSLKIMQALVAVPVAVSVLVLITNLFRWIKIMKFQKALSSKK